MPMSSASRGDLKCTVRPSTRYSPLSGGCTPASVLMSVLLPAPLSPSRQCTSPRLRRSVTPFSAITEPKNLLTSSSSRMWSTPLMARPSVATERNALADVGIEKHRGKQHGAKEDAIPVVVDAGVADPDLHHAEDERTDRRSDDGAVAARKEATADDCRDDGLEFLLQAAVRRGGAGVGDLQDSEQRRA